MVSVRFNLLPVVLKFVERKNWFGLFRDANVVLTSVSCCTLFQLFFFVCAVGKL